MTREDVVLLVDEKGRRFLVRLRDEMVEIGGLGTFSSENIRRALDSGELSVAHRRLTVRPASVDDVLSVIERRAQVMTSKDIGTVLHLCDIRCGAMVIEGGVGSGALTIAMLASVGDDGSVTSYEVREEFAAVARRNIERAGLSGRWTLRLLDICKGIEERQADAVVVDIPNPWECVRSAEQALRQGGTICAFVPNVNQLEETVRALRGGRFSDIRALETLQREMVVHERGTRPSFDMLGHTGYLILGRKKG